MTRNIGIRSAYIIGVANTYQKAPLQRLFYKGSLYLAALLETRTNLALHTEHIRNGNYHNACATDCRARQNQFLL